MLKRLLFVAGFAAGLIALGSAARADSIGDRIAAHRAQIEAKIACDTAQMQGKSCSAPLTFGAMAPATSTAPSRASSSAASGGAKRIDISLSEQRLRAFEGGQVVLDAPIESGTAAHPTPTGNFSIHTHEQMHWDTKYNVWMPLAMQVTGDIFIHSLPVTTDGTVIGAGALGSPQSHGCIRLSSSDASFLFNWAPNGTPVSIHE